MNEKKLTKIILQNLIKKFANLEFNKQNLNNKSCTRTQKRGMKLYEIKKLEKIWIKQDGKLLVIVNEDAK